MAHVYIARPPQNPRKTGLKRNGGKRKMKRRRRGTLRHPV